MTNTNGKKVVCATEFGFQAPEHLRIQDATYGGLSGSNTGGFSIPSLDQSFGSKRHLLVRAKLSGAWRGVSVRACKKHGQQLILKTPSFYEMQQIRQQFWQPEITVVQFQPSLIEDKSALELYLWQFIPELAGGNFGFCLPVPPFEIFEADKW